MSKTLICGFASSLTVWDIVVSLTFSQWQRQMSTSPCVCGVSELSSSTDKTISHRPPLHCLIRVSIVSIISSPDLSESMSQLTQAQSDWRDYWQDLISGQFSGLWQGCPGRPDLATNPTFISFLVPMTGLERKTITDLSLDFFSSNLKLMFVLPKLHLRLFLCHN